MTETRNSLRVLSEWTYRDFESLLESIRQAGVQNIKKSYSGVLRSLRAREGDVVLVAQEQVVDGRKVLSVAVNPEADEYEVTDPFTGQVVKILARLTDRLRGRYAMGPTLPSGEPEFGFRQMPTVPIQLEAACEIDRLREKLRRRDDAIAKALKNLDEDASTLVVKILRDEVEDRDA